LMSSFKAGAKFLRSPLCNRHFSNRNHDRTASRTLFHPSGGNLLGVARMIFGESAFWGEVKPKKERSLVLDVKT
jgi:hypothetical protein